jgi:3-phosphoshikimate 1-carboxyvinyltransferase
VGSARVPGDKSLSHRAVLFSAMAEGTSNVSGVLDSADVRSTIEAVESLGAQVRLEVRDSGLAGEIVGWGAAGPKAPAAAIDCGNSGTTARLLMGVVSGWPITVTLTGDESLSRRPMLRVTGPLSLMGASFELADKGTLPVKVSGRDVLHALEYDSPVASAQVKSAVLHAGTRADGRTLVTEPSLSRDHTERLLPAFGIPVETGVGGGASVMGPVIASPAVVAVPGDASSAAFIVAAALLVPGSAVSLVGVSLNPTRIGFLRVLERMGAKVDAEAQGEEGTEPRGRLSVSYTGELRATSVEASEVASLIDEVPVLALIASQASGTTRFSGVGELRVKESDRLSAMCKGLAALGAEVRSGEDWLEVDGPCVLREAALDSFGDHRLAMCWALAGVAGERVTVGGYESVGVSYPRFAEDLESLGA